MCPSYTEANPGYSDASLGGECIANAAEYASRLVNPSATVDLIENNQQLVGSLLVVNSLKTMMYGYESTPCAPALGLANQLSPHYAYASEDRHQVFESAASYAG